MKRHLPHNILLAVTLLVTGFAVFYNLSLQESFSVLVRYDPPAVRRKAAESAPEPEQGREEVNLLTESVQWEEAFALWEDEEDGFAEEPAPDEAAVSFPLDLNEAVYEELVLIPKIGDVTAQRILQYRDVLGGYDRLEQLMEIKGIGEKTFESISPWLYVGDE